MRLHFQCEHRAVVLEEVAIRFQPQQVAHPDPEFRSVDRFAQELFRSGIEDGQARAAVDLRGHHDDRDIRRGRIGLEQRGKFVSVHPRHHDVEQDQVRRALCNRGKRFIAIGCGEREIAFSLQQCFEQPAVLELVIDDQDHGSTTGHGIGSSGMDVSAACDPRLNNSASTAAYSSR